MEIEAKKTISTLIALTSSIFQEFVEFLHIREREGRMKLIFLHETPRQCFSSEDQTLRGHCGVVVTLRNCGH